MYHYLDGKLHPGLPRGGFLGLHLRDSQASYWVRPDDLPGFLDLRESAVVVSTVKVASPE